MSVSFLLRLGGRKVSFDWCELVSIISAIAKSEKRSGETLVTISESLTIDIESPDTIAKRSYKKHHPRKVSSLEWRSPHLNEIELRLLEIPQDAIAAHEAKSASRSTLSSRTISEQSAPHLKLKQDSIQARCQS